MTWEIWRWIFAGAITLAFWFVAFVTICAIIGANRAFRRMPEALKGAFDRPPDAETIARAVILREIAAGHATQPLWVYDPRRREYHAAADAAEIAFRAREFGQALVLRYDRDTEQFSTETVTPDMPVAEIME